MLFETSADNAELIKKFGTAAALPIGDSALAALYQAGNQNTDFTMFRQAGYLGLNFALMDGTAAYHNSVDTAERLDKAGLQHMARTRSALPEASVIVIVQARRLGSLIWYPMWSVWPLVGLAIAIMVVLGVLARQRGEATVPRMLASGAAALLQIIVAPWPGSACGTADHGSARSRDLFMGDPCRPDSYRWALAALTAGHRSSSRRW